MSFEPKLTMDEGTRAIVKEIAREVLDEADKRLNEKIKTHSLECSVLKYRKRDNFISGILGGTIVAGITVLMWIALG